MSGPIETISLRRPPFAGSNFAREALQAVRAHPAFPQAAQQLARGFVDLYQGNRLLNTIVNDRGRMLVGYFAIYLHFFGPPGDPTPGLTVSRMKKVCSDLGICSPGRAETMLILMRMFGHLETAPAMADRRTRLLVPSRRLLESVHIRWQMQFDAMAPVLPEIAAAMAVVRQADFTAALIRRLGERFFAGLRLVEHAPGFELFADRNAGVLIAYSLLLAGERGDAFPPQRPVRLSISAAARRFGVSRVHVRKLLRDAEDEGYLARAGSADGEVALQPRFIDATLDFIASAFLYLGHCAVVAVDEIERQHAAA
jgi:CRP-like cAMP-binding protein